MPHHEKTEKKWKDLKKILCVRLDTLGDILMTAPALAELKAQNPQRELTLLTSSIGAEIAPLIPEINKTIIFDAPWMKATIPYYNSVPVMKMINCLKKERFEAAIIFTVYSQTSMPAAMLCFLAEIPKRASYSHENPYQLLTDWFPDPEPQKYVLHEIKRQLALVTELNGGRQISNGKIKLKIEERTKQRVKEILKNEGVDLKKPWLVLHPGARFEERIFSPSIYIEAAKKIREKTEFQILVTGTAKEKELINSVAAQIGDRAFPLFNKFNLSEFIALLDLSSLIITNNTGPAHMAAALNMPEIVLYANTNPQHTPWNKLAKVLHFDVSCKQCERGVCALIHTQKKQEVNVNDIVNAFFEIVKQ